MTAGGGPPWWAGAAGETPLVGSEGGEGAFLGYPQPSNHPQNGSEGGSNESGNGENSVVDDDAAKAKLAAQAEARIAEEMKKMNR